MTSQRKHLTLAALGMLLGVASTAAGAGWAASQYLGQLMTCEAGDRLAEKIDRVAAEHASTRERLAALEGQHAQK